MSRKPLAVVTMVYNERELLPLWHRYYAGQVGERACYVVDHGSTDGSTHHLGDTSVVRIPRSPQDDERRTRAIGQLCASLLEWYDSVIYTDVDELLVADPHQYSSLAMFATCSHLPVVTATGFDIVHGLGTETALDLSQLVSLQRRRLRFTSAMCKPVLIRQSVTWAPGFHCCQEARPSPHRGLFLFHLRYADLDAGLRRLARTRAQPWSSDQAGTHQRMDDADWHGMLENMAALPLQDGALDNADHALTTWRERVEQSVEGREKALYRLDLHLNSDRLWHLPDRFFGRF